VLAAPFPWFGGTRKVAAEVWRRFGDVVNYVEPFYGSGAVLLGRPRPFSGNETINDADGLVANFWRAIQHDPEATAAYADHPVNENDLHARHVWLVGQIETLRARLEGNPEFYDAKIAGWWVWGVSCWIGSGFCSGTGPWGVHDGQLVHLGGNGQGVNRKLVHLGDSGRGVNRKLVHLGDSGRGVNRQLVHLGGSGRGVNRQRVHLSSWFGALSDRLRSVRVASGDWSRVCGPSVTFTRGMTGVFLDPPYADTANRESDLYRVDCQQVAHQVRAWALEHGTRPDMRIALCGYEGEHQMPSSWATYAWSARDGYGVQATDRTGNHRRERIWFSPACLSAEQPSLFDATPTYDERRAEAGACPHCDRPHVTYPGTCASRDACIFDHGKLSHSIQ
jgi:site-specific DNA-adenine methylase